MKELTSQYGPWATRFKEIYDGSVTKYKGGARGAENLVTSG